MRRRFLQFALAYCLLTIALCLFPPFGDGRHHFYRWHPSTASDLNAVVAYVGEDTIEPGQIDRVLNVSLVSLGIEATVAFLAVLTAALAVELARTRRPAASARE